ncbi:AAA domain-containing protein [Chryseobacterium foetidum]|uniref:AAA domain-containing protein n=1 Tax=Chryseobacterium foetidum TaxID=2951057 RepID=UPI0021C9EA01|nr:AAA domain-containing protein [Chryseobacterium foetidum]
MQKSTSQKLDKQAIYIDGKNRTDEVESYSLEGAKCVVTFKNNGRSYSYHQSKIKIIKSAFVNERAKNIFCYLKEIAENTGVKTQEGLNTLFDCYNKITFIPEASILSNYLNGKEPKSKSNSTPIDLFPFGFNLSQKKAANEAFINPLTVIEGPPGTGKTQTILNIIANAVLNNQTVVVVSNNNSATKNVFEKLEANGLSFIAAVLGNSQNRQEFLDVQSEIPNLSEFMLTDEDEQFKRQSNSVLFTELSEKLEQKNELAALKLEIDKIKTEYNHFTKNIHFPRTIIFKKNINSEQLLSLWITLGKYEQSGKKLKWWNKVTFPFFYGLRDKEFYNLTYQEMISAVQSKYYNVKISELEHHKQTLENSLQDFSFNDKMKNYTEVSMRLFKNELFKKYQKTKRPKYSYYDLRFNSDDFLKDYPVIMSTTYSIKKCLSENIMYDFVIVDESSQVNLATGALALSCAKQAVIVGDLKQLSHVVESEKIQSTDFIFQSYQIPEPYRYSQHSLLSSVIELFPNIPRTLLREHYRCHPKIIDFCNRKFYNNELIILSEGQDEKEPILVYRTVAGNHARDKTNYRQIDSIMQEIIPQNKLQNTNLGIVTPYRNQTTALQNAVENTKIIADTVDKFQGRENDVIILSTVDNEISNFTSDSNRLNVAVSRAKDQLILVVNGNEIKKDDNISDLISYIEYNNFTVVNSEIHSIFDYLYKGYEAKLKILLANQKKKSVFDSENLMYYLITDVLETEAFSKYDVILHFPLRNLISNFDKLSAEEEKYAKHYATHLDFLIYNKLGKNPVLAIEVDGYEYHQKESRQAERDDIKNRILEKYGISLLRFSTTGSGEKEKLIRKLTGIKN